MALNDKQNSRQNDLVKFKFQQNVITKLLTIQKRKQKFINMDIGSNSEFIRTIEWDMMDKTKFFPLSMLSSFSIRCCFYPLTLIKTQLQVQFKNNVYSGMFDAGCKIYRAEGAAGFYRGFWISSVQIFSGVFYISTYEGVRHILSNYGANQQTKSLIGGMLF